MKIARPLVVIGFFIFAGLHRTPAQEPMRVDAHALGLYRIHTVPLVYPAIARAAGVQGTVVLLATIDTSGKVASTKIISGPPMLQQAAIDCVKQWTYLQTA